MKKKQTNQTKTCADCVHEYACAMWNVGTIHDMDAAHCINHETFRQMVERVMSFKELIQSD